MKKLLPAAVLLMLMGGVVAADLSFIMVVKQDDSQLQVKELTLVNGAPSSSDETDTAYTAQVISYNGSVLAERGFSFPVLLHSANASWFNEDGEQIYEPQADPSRQTQEAVIRLPYHRTAASIRIVDTAGETVLTADTGRFAVCNLDDRCGTGESVKTCPEDCGAGSGGNPLLWLLAGIAVAAVVAGAIYRRKVVSR